MSEMLEAVTGTDNVFAMVFFQVTTTGEKIEVRLEKEHKGGKLRAPPLCGDDVLEASYLSSAANNHIRCGFGCPQRGLQTEIDSS